MPGEPFDWITKMLSRRRLLSGGAAVTGAGLAGLLSDGRARAQTMGAASAAEPNALCPNGQHADSLACTNSIVGSVDNERNGFDPHEMLTDWDTGTLTRGPNGERVREFTVTAIDKEIEIAPGVMFPAWTYNGRVPGPTLRCTEGELLRVRFINAGSMPHTMHFHGIHSARMDGVPGAGQANPGAEFVYEFTAKPFGCHLYHCHTLPLKRHMHKGLYGAFIVDPDPARHPDQADVAESRLLGSPANARWQELVMVMNGFDTNFDEENEFYAVNSIAFAYQNRPIEIDRTRPVRIYLVNVTEFDPINSLHLHANFFDYYDHGTTLSPTLRTVDTIMQCQAQRGIIEIDFSEHEPGLYMFHAHQAEFTELGWMANFKVV